jgi:hypothetical protein
VLGWSIHVIPGPGPYFTIERLKVLALKSLADPITDNSPDQLRLVGWSEGAYIHLEFAPVSEYPFLQRKLRWLRMIPVMGKSRL